MKKLLSIALCLTMLSGICTATTHAAEAASETKTVTVDKNSCVVTRKDTLLYSLPKGGLDYPYERHYYKKNDNKALFATYRCVNTYDSTGYDWYECVLVSADKDATLMYTTPTNWMPGYGKTESLEYRGENWYYTYGAAMHVAREDEPKNVFCLNDVTGVKLYKEMEDVVKDLIDFYMGADSETEIENDEEVKEDVVENTPSKDAEEDSKKEDTSKEEVVEDETSKDTVEVEDVVTDDKTSEDEEKDTTDEEYSKEEEKEAVADEETSKD